VAFMILFVKFGRGEDGAGLRVKLRGTESGGAERGKAPLQSGAGERAKRRSHGTIKPKCGRVRH